MIFFVVLQVFGDGSVAQVVLSKGAAGSFLTINLAWGFAVAMAVWISGGVSGSHVNPAVTLTLCLMGREQWKRLIPYWLAQYAGGFLASACIYGVYVGGWTSKPCLYYINR
jgi:aquaporin-3